MRLFPLQDVMANQDTTDGEESPVDVVSPLVADAKSPELVQPGEGAFHHPPRLSQAASVGCISFRQDGLDTQRRKQAAGRIGIVSSISLNRIRTMAWTTAFAPDRWNRLDQRKSLSDVVDVSTGEGGRQRNPTPVGDQMVFTAAFRPIGGVRASLPPPFRARIEALSMTARDQSIWLAWFSLANSTSWIFCQTPASCQSCNRRQHVIPEPQPISCGRYSQPMPVFSTNRMPVRASRLPTRFRPGYRKRLGFGGGKKGSISDHNSLERIGFAIWSSPSLISFPYGYHRPLFSQLNSFC